MLRTALPLLVVGLFLLPLGALSQTQTPPASLAYQFGGSLFLQANGALNETEAATGQQCVVLQSPTATAQTKPFKVPRMPFVGTWTVNRDIGLVLVLMAATGNTPSSSGFTATAELTEGDAGKKLLGAKSSVSYAPPAPMPTSLSFTFPGSENASYASAGGTLGVRVTMTPVATTGAVQNVAVQCDRGSKIEEPIQILRGALGDMDTDGDGMPDREDPDDDNDGFADVQEAVIQCVVGPVTFDFSKNSRLQPGDHDGDGDGNTDEQECGSGFDPTSALSRIPPPKPFPWGLIILALLAIALAAGLYFFIVTFGKSASLVVVSSSELFIKPGTTGKYEVEATSLRKKGDPITYQLSVHGLPDGWDAKLSTDHVVLENLGTGKEKQRFFLTVEAPEHTDPESAVVRAKAIALNKAGRKDTAKLPARCRTITSINVPPGAKVPVKRGGPVQMKTEEEEAKTDEKAAEKAAKATAKAAAKEEKKSKKEKEKEGKEEPSAPRVVPAKPQLQVGSLAHYPPVFKQGETVKSTVTVANQGAAEQKVKLSLFVNDALADAQTVALKPGKSREIKFKWTAQERNKLNLRGELLSS